VTDPVTSRRRLAHELRRLRTAKDMTQRQVAEQMAWSPSKIIRIEQGTVGIAVTDLMALLMLYGIAGNEVDEFVELARSARARTEWARFRDHFSASTLRCFALESSSVRIRHYAAEVVPPLLQTEEYIRAQLAGLGTDTRIDGVVEVTHIRQELLEREQPPELFVVVDEAALRRAVGGPAVLRQQLDHLAAMAHRPFVSVQILRFAVGAHPQLGRGAFTYLEFADESNPDVLILPGPDETQLIDIEEVTSLYLDRFFRLEAMASAPFDVERLLRELAEDIIEEVPPEPVLPALHHHFVLQG
jgi:transcriptional regulator with XRE-family HTH domain